LIVVAPALSMREQLVTALENVSAQILAQTNKCYRASLSPLELISQRAVDALLLLTKKSCATRNNPTTIEPYIAW
jgi:hypothetical protein